jgi:flagellar assembly protein FliH
MSFKARKVQDPAAVQPFSWSETRTPEVVPAATTVTAAAPGVHDAVERDAFIKGYAQGERAGAEAAGKRAEGMLRRLKDTLDELAGLRAEMLHRTERQIVQLSLAIAKRVVTREISLDRGLLVAMARSALDRLGDHASATIRLHPEDYAAVSAGLPQVQDGHVQIKADPLVSRGSCLVQSDFGVMDVTPEAQFDELARVLLDEEEPVAPRGSRP